MNPLISEFDRPGTAYRGKPFWSWNGELDEAELVRQIHRFKEMGFGGFFMHSRTGLETEYLGEDWFRLSNRCADEAAKLGLEAWLYDEDRWPSGTAGGLVTQRPEFRSQFISVRVLQPSEFAWDAGIVAAFVADIDGLAISNLQRLLPGDSASNIAGARSVLVFRVELSEPSSFYNGNSYVDTMNRTATDTFIDLTHKQYLEKCGPRIGNSIRGIFTDEPHRGAVMCGFAIDNANRYWMAPWTDTLQAEFQAAFGYDLLDRLPEIFFNLNGDPVSPVKWQYVELLQRLFLQNFAKPMFDWCTQNGLQLTGHALHEDTLTAQVCMQGSLMRFYEFMHVPGIDILGEATDCFWAAKQLASAARQNGQTWLLSELYGATGWQMGFEGHKAVGDWQALFGINVRCHHLAWYSMQGEAKRDYPASIGHQSAWWRDYDYVETYFARLGVLLRHGRSTGSLLVINPVESLWCQIHGGWAKNLAPVDDSIKQLEAGYAELFGWLAGSQTDFDYGDEEMMSRLARVSRDAANEAILQFGHATYHTILVGRTTTLRSSTLQLLADFAAAGGRVIFAGEAPTYIDAVPSVQAKQLAARTQQVAWDRDAVVAAVTTACETCVKITLDDGDPASSIFAQLRTDDVGQLVIVALNTDRVNGFKDVRVRLSGADVVADIAEWDCATGEKFAVDTRMLADGSVEFTADFVPGGSRAYVIASGIAAGLAKRRVLRDRRVHPLDQGLKFELTEPNVCVLDTARFRIDAGEWQGPTEVLKIDREIRSAFGLQWRSGEMVQPWFRRRISSEAAPVLGSVTLAFEFDIDAMPTGPVDLALEQPKLFRVCLNGHPIDTTRTTTGEWIDNAFHRVAIGTALRPGRNELTLETDFTEETNIEAVYLLGAFGVQITNTRATLIELPATLTPGDAAIQGLPFYGGTIRYILPLRTLNRNGDRLLLRVPQLNAACAKVIRAGFAPLMMAWHPYEADVTDLAAGASELQLDVVLTRRNTFGPLHQQPVRTRFYGPDNFVSTGERWTNEYALDAGGLLAAPLLVEAEEVAIAVPKKRSRAARVAV